MPPASTSAISEPATRGSAARNDLPALTGVRFFAAATVVFGHFWLNGLIGAPARLFEVLDGRSAVSLFFVLSGFILTYTYEGRLMAGTVRKFYLARFARIYPVLALSLLISAVGIALIFFKGRQDLLLTWFAINGHIALSLIASLLAQLTVITGWLPFAALNQPYNGPAWSLSCEAFFYALFPFLLRRLKPLSWRKRLAWAMAAFIFQIVWIRLILHFAPLGRSGFLVAQFPVTHLAEFIFGIVAGIMFVKGEARTILRGPRSIVLFWCLLALLFVVAYFDPAPPCFVLESPLFALLILCLALRPGAYPLFSNRFSVLLGQASFSLYLLHVPLLHLAQLLGVGRLLGLPLILAIVLLSISVFRYYEEPLRRRIVMAAAKPRTLET